jgi:hypothetical protein
MAQRLVDAVWDLPDELATSMLSALRDDAYRVGAGKYNDGSDLCPLGAADAVAEAEGKGRFAGWSQDEPTYAGRLLRFADRASRRRTSASCS